MKHQPEHVGLIMFYTCHKEAYRCNQICRFHRNLVLLDCDGDPVWDAINVHYKYITQQLSLCKEKHMAAESNSEDSGSFNYKFTRLMLRVVLVQFNKPWNEKKYSVEFSFIRF